MAAADSPIRPRPRRRRPYVRDHRHPDEGARTAHNVALCNRRSRPTTGSCAPTVHQHGIHTA
ncbi:hypothetical protein I551_5607 [Mycobacterium ulcerans str. Harvey]|uniref:Uncharacterized protein n=1 Tax=Mycobacterium ulcerans str. Harvey TaxID=1299332 RepID=A0ABN0QT56_MYCUL|nr:hypothetical protein I551_5607 [Mycobacterium ulcerans str. Harvey]